MWSARTSEASMVNAIPLLVEMGGMLNVPVDLQCLLRVLGCSKTFRCQSTDDRHAQTAWKDHFRTHFHPQNADKCLAARICIFCRKEYPSCNKMLDHVAVQHFEEDQLDLRRISIDELRHASRPLLDWMWKNGAISRGDFLHTMQPGFTSSSTTVSNVLDDNSVGTNQSSRRRDREERRYEPARR